MKSEDLKKIEDMIQSLALSARQSGAPSHVLLEMKRDIKDLREDTLKIVEQTTRTNGRVTKLETKVLIVAVAITVVAGLKFPELTKLIQYLAI